MGGSAPQLLLRCCMLTPELYDPGAHTPEGAVYATAFPTPSAISPLMGTAKDKGRPGHFECLASSISKLGEDDGGLAERTSTSPGPP